MKHKKKKAKPAISMRVSVSARNKIKARAAREGMSIIAFVDALLK